MQLGHKSSNTNVTWVISFQIEASLQYNLATDRTLGPADTGQASGLFGLGPETRPSTDQPGTMQMQLGHKSSNTNVTWVISFQIAILNT